MAAGYGLRGCVDVVFMFHRTHVVASRVVSADADTADPDDGVVWLTEGRDLREVAGELLALPAPGEPGAPELVISAGTLLGTP